MFSTPQTVVSYPKFPIDTKAEKRAARTGTVSVQQYYAMMNVLPAHMKPLLATVMFTGIRSKETKFIRWSQIDWVNKRILLSVGETKNDRSRVVPMPHVVEAKLLEWKAITDEYYPGCEWVFHFDGKHIKSYKTAWNTACRTSGLVRPKLIVTVHQNLSKEVNIRANQSWRTLYTSMILAAVLGP